MAPEEDFFSRWARRKAQVERERAPACAPSTPPASEDATSAAATTPPVRPPAAPASAQSAQGSTASANPGGADGPAPADAEAAPPQPTLDEARALTPQDDFRRFVTPQVDPQVRNTALKRLFADPHFNVMDRLDIYIDDYNKPDPLPAGMLRQMAQSAALGLFSDEKAQPPATGDGRTGPPPAPGDAEAAPSGDTPQAPDDTLPAAPDTPQADAHAPESPADENPDLRLQPHDAAGHRVDRPHAGGDAGREH